MAEGNVRKRRGPRATVGTPDQKSTISVRVSADLKNKLVAAMATNDRSLSQEAEARLEQSFLEGEALERLLDGIYGSQLTGLLTVLGRVMTDTGRVAGVFSLGTYDWMLDPFAYDRAMRNAVYVLEALRPDGEPVVRMQRTAEDRKLIEHICEGLPRSTLKAIGDPNIGGELGQWARPVRAKLGPVAKRARKLKDA